MNIFLDTNIIKKAHFFRANNAQIFLKAAKLLGLKIIIPEVVIDEVFGNYRKTLIEKIDKFNAATKDLLSVIDNQKIQEFNNKELEVEAKYTEYKLWFRKLVEDNNVKILNYPDVTCQDIVQNSNESKKPFNNKGIGHKDFLIWKTICTFTTYSKPNELIFFITNNHKDFAEEGGSKTGSECEIHPELKTQLPEESPEVMIYLDLESFIKRQITPLLDGVTLEETVVISQKVNERVEDSLLEKLEYYTLYQLEGVPFADLSIGMVGPHKVFDTEIKIIDGDEILINIEGAVDLEIFGFMDKSDYYSEKTDVYISDPNWNSHVMEVSTSITTPFELLFSYSKVKDEFTGVDLILMDEISEIDY